MTINSRNKGSSYEREVARDLELLTGVKFKRNLEQVRAEDQSDLMPDCEDWPFALEAKRYASGTGCKPAWQAQASAAAAKLGRLPAVIFRYDRRTSRVSIPLRAIRADAPAEFWIETCLEGFACIATEMMAERALARADE